tara:strand:- start:322 stop:792 length:471 start_codon:yes stop_codon:yes gene_type:complete
MSIKYSEILAADEVLSAGNDDVIVLAIVDGGSPTGYTTKAIKKSNLISGGQIKAFQTLTDAANIAWDYALGYNAEVALTASRILDEPTNVSDGDYGTLVIVQGGAGSHTLTLPASFKVVNGGAGAITLSTAASSIDSISWVYRGADFLVTVGVNFN